MIGRFLCWLGSHRAPPGLNERWCAYWSCLRCSQLVPGRRPVRR